MAFSEYIIWFKVSQPREMTVTTFLLTHAESRLGEPPNQEDS